MRGVSRESLRRAQERLDEVLSSVDAAALGGELFAVLHLLDREHALRRAVSDPARPAEQKAQLVRMLFEGKVDTVTLDLVADLVGQAWARSGDLTDALERLAVSATIAQIDGPADLDDLEDNLFRFTRVVAGEPGLRAALSDPALPADRKQELLDALLDGRVHAATRRLIVEAATHSRGRSVERSLDEYARIAADRRKRLIAVVHTAIPLTVEQKSRLAATLSAQYGSEVHVNTEVDPRVLGGMSVQVGDEQINGTVAARLADVRRRLGAES
jgi:F-type H+-transporting ATPase subunit delta